MARNVNLKCAFYYYLSEYNNKDAPGTHAHMMNPYQNLINGYILK